MILFSVLCTVREVVRAEYGKELAQSLKEKNNERLREFLARTTDNGQRDTRGVLRGPRGPKNDDII